MPYAQNNGVNIYYEVEGVGVPLVLLHGLTQDLLHWREFGWTDQLRQAYQLILIDIRGHGVTDKPYEGEAYQLELLAQDVLAVLDKISIRQAHCCGFSYGGRICFQLAQSAPERFYSFVIIGSHPMQSLELVPGRGKRSALGLICM